MRIIPRLDIKGKNLIKGIQFEGLRVIGTPNDFARKYYEEGADELIFMDSVASLYGRNQLESVLREAVTDIFVPITVGGGITSVEEAIRLLRAGADKVAVNTAAISRPKLLNELASELGSQSVVLSIEAKKQPEGHWEAYSENGRQRTGLDVLEWAEKAETLGAGEIFLTSVDRDGTEKGFDIELLNCIRKATELPIIFGGGFGSVNDLSALMKKGIVDAISMGSALHYQKTSIPEIRHWLANAGVEMRILNER